MCMYVCMCMCVCACVRACALGTPFCTYVHMYIRKCMMQHLNFPGSCVRVRVRVRVLGMPFCTYILKRMTDAASEVSSSSAVVTLCNRTDTLLAFFSIGVFVSTVHVRMYLEMYVCVYIRLGSICRVYGMVWDVCTYVYSAPSIPSPLMCAFWYVWTVLKLTAGIIQYIHWALHGTILVQLGACRLSTPVIECRSLVWTRLVVLFLLSPSLELCCSVLSYGL